MLSACESADTSIRNTGEIGECSWAMSGLYVVKEFSGWGIASTGSSITARRTGLQKKPSHPADWQPLPLLPTAAANQSPPTTQTARLDRSHRLASVHPVTRLQRRAFLRQLQRASRGRRAKKSKPILRLFSSRTTA